MLDILQEYDSEYHMEGDLGNAARRDPDAMPPENLFQLLMSWVYRGYNEFFSGNSLFALKAGVLTSKLYSSAPAFPVHHTQLLRQSC